MADCLMPKRSGQKEISQLVTEFSVVWFIPGLTCSASKAVFPKVPFYLPQPCPQVCLMGMIKLPH